MIAHELRYLAEQDAKKLLASAASVGRSLSGLINALRGSHDLEANDQQPKTKDQYV